MTQSPSSPFPILKIEGPPGSGKTLGLAREACRLMGQEGYTTGQLQFLAATNSGKSRLMRAFKQEAQLAGLNTEVSGIPSVDLLEEWLLSRLQEVSPAGNRPLTCLSDLEARLILQDVLRQAIPEGHLLGHAARQASLARVFLDVIRQLQLKGLSPAVVQAECQAAQLPDERLVLLGTVYHAFNSQTQTANLLCPAQVPHRLLEAWEASAPALQKVRERFPVLLIDEAQELSPVQQRLLALLECRLVLAGNENLSIRSFRGADPQGFKTLAVFAPKPVTFLNQPACLRGNEPILSLLNTLLPQPIWEEHALDAGRLAEMVQFAYWANPQQEAEFLAEQLTRFVRGAAVAASPLASGAAGERWARWRDCVVLLRSAHYKPQLLQAFQQCGIPYQSELLAEEAIRLQHGLYDLFTVLEGWQSQGISEAEIVDPSGLLIHWRALGGSFQERELWTGENNRHLLRCLETLLLSEAQRNDLHHLSAFEHARPGEVAWLLPFLVNPETCPPALTAAVHRLVSFYRKFRLTGSPLVVAEAVIDALPLMWGDAEAVTPALSGWALVHEKLSQLSAHYQAAVGQPIPLRDLLAQYPALWEDAEVSPLKASRPDAVRILSLHQVQGGEFPLVCIPFLVGGEFPYTRELPELLSPKAQALLGISAGYQIEETEEARLLAVGMSRATHQLILSSHARDDSGVVVPSAFFTTLWSQRRGMLGQPQAVSLCELGAAPDLLAASCGVDLCVHHLPEPLEIPNELVSLPSEVVEDRYTGNSLWAKLDRQSVEPLFEAEETLTLSASSMKTYMQCPRQFYYKHLLRLPQPSHEAAVLGTLIHRVMEVFNRQAESGLYTAEALQEIAKRLFDFKDDPEAFHKAGFDERDLLTLSKMSPLALFQLRQRLLASIEDLAQKGYFNRYGTLRRVYPERALEGVTLSGLERVRFRGTMDAVIELADGSVEILDYKTFRSAYGKGLEICDKHFRDTLAPLPEEDDVSHTKRFASKLNPEYPTDYQLPLYYLACRQDPEFGHHLRAVALQMIRPAFPNNPHQGSIRLELPGELIEARKEQLLDELRRFIIEPILDTEAFAPNPSRLNCSSCAYYGICETAEEASLGEEGLE